MRYQLFFCVLGTLIVLAIPALAPAAEESVQTLLDRGNDLRRKGDHAKALDAFQRAHDLKPSAKTLAQIGLVLHDLKRWLEAEARLTEALGSKDPWIRRNKEPLEATLKAVRGHIGELVVQGPVAARVIIDGKPAGDLPLNSPIKVGAGVVKVEVLSSGTLPFEKSARISPGQLTVVDATPARVQQVQATVPTGEASREPVVGVDQAVTDAAPSHPRGGKIAGGALVAAGVAAIVSGVVWLAVDGNGTCDPPAGGVCPKRYNTDVQGWLAIGGGAAAAAGGGILLYRSSRSSMSLSLSPFGAAAVGRF